MTPPGFSMRVPITSLCPTVRSARSSLPSVLLSLSPPAGAALSLSPWCFGHSVLGTKMLLSPGHLDNTESHQPPKGHCGSWGNCSWWWRVGREIQQLLDLCEGPSEPALLGSLRDAHGLDSCEANRMGCAATCKWGDLGWCPTGDGNTEATDAPEVFAGMWMSLSLVTDPVTASGTPSHQPRTLILVSVMGNLTPKHGGLYTKVVHRAGNKPLLWTSSIKTNQWDFLCTFSAFQQKHKTQWESDKIFLNQNTDTNLSISSNIYGIIFQTFFNFSSSFSKNILCFQLFAFTLS